MQGNNASSDAMQTARATATLQAALATPVTPQAARASARAATPQPLESPDPIATTGISFNITGGPNSPIRKYPKDPPRRTNFQGLQSSISPARNPPNAPLPTVSNWPKKAPGGMFDTVGPPGIGTNQGVRGFTPSGSFSFQPSYTPLNATTQ